MAKSYTSKSLQKINKKNLIPIILSLWKKLEERNNNVLVEMRKLNFFSKLKAEVSVTKQVNTLLYSRLVSERQCWLNAQYLWRECLVQWAFPVRRKQMLWRKKWQPCLRSGACDILTEYIETCHWISKKNPTIIVNFLQRKYCQ